LPGHTSSIAIGTLYPLTYQTGTALFEVELVLSQAASSLGISVNEGMISALQTAVSKAREWVGQATSLLN
jgi:hypothetical protein